jgi:hypothetical protein
VVPIVLPLPDEPATLFECEMKFKNDSSVFSGERLRDLSGLLVLMENLSLPIQNDDPGRSRRCHPGLNFPRVFFFESI